MKDMNSETHSCVISLASLAILACAHIGQADCEWEGGQGLSNCARVNAPLSAGKEQRGPGSLTHIAWQRLLHDPADVGNGQVSVLLMAGTSTSLCHQASQVAKVTTTQLHARLAERRIGIEKEVLKYGEAPTGIKEVFELCRGFERAYVEFVN
eukprot:scaffold79221_cov17-Tisochrysis_lutea.AAC.1